MFYFLNPKLNGRRCSNGLRHVVVVVGLVDKHQLQVGPPRAFVPSFGDHQAALGHVEGIVVVGQWEDVDQTPYFVAITLKTVTLQAIYTLRGCILGEILWARFRGGGASKT